MSPFFVVRTASGMLFLNPNNGVLTQLDIYGQPAFQTILDVGHESEFMQCLMEWSPFSCPYDTLLTAICGGNTQYWRRQLNDAFTEKRAYLILKPIIDIASRVRKKLHTSQFEIGLDKSIGYTLSSIREKQHHAA